MKYKDHIYDLDLKTATIKLVEVEKVQLENLLLLLKEEPEQSQDEMSYDTIIFGEN